jgi:hypothetical protein
MKKIYSLIAVVAVVSITAMLVLTPSNLSSQAKATPSKGFAIPDSILAIAKLSCINCHAEGGKSMAMAHVNLTKWDTYTPEKQISKALDMCKQVSKGSMPPKSFRSGHPDGIPTEKQIKTLCSWANSLKIK